MLDHYGNAKAIVRWEQDGTCALVAMQDLELSNLVSSISLPSLEDDDTLDAIIRSTTAQEHKTTAIAALEEAKAAAFAAERYEEAARLRDKIAALSGRR